MTVSWQPPIYPAELAIQPAPGPVRAVLSLPGSKSISNRALPLAALAGQGRGCKLDGVLRSDDTTVMIAALRALGYGIDLTEAAGNWTAVVTRPAGSGWIPASAADLWVGNSGTTVRFLTALLGLGRGRFRLDGVPRMRERPIEDLLVTLRQLGIVAWSELSNGCPPVIVESEGMSGGSVRLRGDVSSQFLSGLLMAAPLARSAVTIEIDGGLVSQPYVDMTVAMMRRFGVRLELEQGHRYHVPGRQEYRMENYVIEPDASAASYFLAMAAITGGSALVKSLGRDSIQGDVRFAKVLEQMGCRVERHQTSMEILGRPLRGLDVDMNDISDCVMTLAAVACFARGATTIRNVAHIRHKETDRLAALANELKRVGVKVDQFSDGLTITPAAMHGALIETYQDHRMAMSMALIGLRVAGIVIRDPACVAKTYPGFFADLERSCTAPPDDTIQRPSASSRG